ncbi:MAG: DNA repair protein RecN [Rikenellaceae bacterium]
MLKRLHIENYAIIENLDIDFEKSLNTVTGETGAGKSILLGALGLLSGVRADSSAVGQGGRSCVVEGEFVVEGSAVEQLLSELEVDYYRTITIRRIIQSEGKSRAYIENTPVTLSVLKGLSDALLDIHSQHKTLLLGRADFQREILDAMAQNSHLFSEYNQKYCELEQLQNTILSLKRAQRKSEEEQDYIAYQIEQLNQANIKSGEQQELETLQRELSNAAEVIEGYSMAEGALSDDEQGALSALSGAKAGLRRIEEYSTGAEELYKRIESCYIEIQDICEDLGDRLSSVEVNPARLQSIEERLDIIYTLAKKHRVESGDNLCEVLEKFQSQLDSIEGGTEDILRKEEQARALKSEALKLAQELSHKRSEVVPHVKRFVEAQLLQLGIAHPRFDAQVTSSEELTPSGCDTIRFLFSANEKMSLQPLESVASGGEMARVMLAIKNLVAQKMELPTIIFDEIDTGVSGAVADAFGDIIEGMSSSMQVINITHLPQIAAKGGSHFEVYKDREGTHIKRLNKEERVERIAAMLSGAEVSDAARKQAKLLLRPSN